MRAGSCGHGAGACWRLRLSIPITEHVYGIETLMSKGPGRIERALAAIFDGKPDNGISTLEP
jgi:hypothetical protein